MAWHKPVSQQLDNMGPHDLRELLKAIARAVVRTAPNSCADAIQEIEVAYDAYRMELTEESISE